MWRRLSQKGNCLHKKRNIHGYIFMNIYKRFTYVKFCGCVREKYLRETTSGKIVASLFTKVNTMKIQFKDFDKKITDNIIVSIQKN